MKYQPIPMPGGKAALHPEDMAALVDALKKGWTDDKELFDFAQYVGINFVKTVLEFRPNDSGQSECP